MLPTPVARDWKGKGYDGQLPTELDGLVRLIPTPNAQDGSRGADFARATRQESGGDDLLTFGVKLLPTPTSKDGIGSRRSTARTPEWTSNTGTTLTDAALESSGVDTRAPSGVGKTSSAGLRLNPLFVEWLMGAPEGWSDPDCPLSATEFNARSDESPGSTS